MLGPSTLPPSKTALAMSRGISSTQPVNYDQDVQALIQGAPIEVAVQGALDGGFLGMTNAIKRSPGGPQVAAMLDPFVATYTNAPRTPDEIRVPREIAGASYRYFSEVRDILEAGLDSGAYADETTRAQAQSAIGGLNQLLTNYHRGAGQGRGEASDRLAVWAMSAGVPEALQSDPIAAGRFLSDRIHAQVAEFKRAKETLTKIAPQDAKLYRQQIQLRRRIFKARLKGDTATADQLVQQMYDLSDQRQALHSPLAGGQAPASPSANFAPSNRPEPGSVEAGNEQFRGMSPGGTSHIDYENYDEFLLGMKPPMED